MLEMGLCEKITALSARIQVLRDRGASAQSRHFPKLKLSSRLSKMRDARQVVETLIAKLDQRAPLSADAREALLTLPFEFRTYPRHHYLVREDECVQSAKLLVEGFAFRHRVTAQGLRQIVSLHIPGDFLDLEASLLRVADHSVQAMEQCTVAQVPRAALLNVIDRFGAIAHALWIDTLIDASVYREWVVNVGRRDARQAMCHLFCELGSRLEFAGLIAAPGYFQMPLTQDQLADCLGITPVHVNRTLRGLDQEGLINRHERFIEVPDWNRLKEIGGFDERYLHFELLAGSALR